MSIYIFIIIGLFFIGLSTQVVNQLGVCILYCVCAIFCFLISYALIFQKKQMEENKKVREFFIDKNPKEMLNWQNQFNYHTYVDTDSVSKIHSQENQTL